MYLFWCLLISVLEFTIQEKVKVSVYYESLCPASKQFISRQLYPGYQLLGDNSLTVDLIPYVNRVKNVNKNKNGYRLICQHGKEECYANKVHACVLHLNATQKAQISFIECHLQTSDLQDKDDIKKCLRSNNLAWSDIKDCLIDEGTQYLVEYHKQAKSLRPPLEYLPHIIFNDKTDRDEEQNSRREFIKIVCSKFKDEKPNGCPQDFE
ncbi:gamma-interferon-inducible lysosomal thiol reductase-like [Diorhabda sublineata]|uniref:gamma-interferon-inducible lysosomal thiol reductase-like n=1 Tax=Diorhabda sublineata TaxID=1163346 RepID=UPI0024E0DCB4|nr:gamma-interferon-inducible lysosomal thiol reductase-like [Diorhabda sublineata]